MSDIAIPVLVVADLRKTLIGQGSPLEVPFGQHSTLLAATLARLAATSAPRVVAYADAEDNRPIAGIAAAAGCDVVVAPSSSAPAEVATFAVAQLGCDGAALVDARAAFVSAALVRSAIERHCHERADLTLCLTAAHGLAPIVVSAGALAQIAAVLRRHEGGAWDQEQDLLYELARWRCMFERVVHVRPPEQLVCVPANLIPRSPRELSALAPFALDDASEDYRRVFGAACQRAWSAWPAARRRERASDRPKLLLHHYHDGPGGATTVAEVLANGIDRERFDLELSIPFLPARLADRVTPLAPHVTRNQFFYSAEQTLPDRWWVDGVARSARLLDDVAPDVVLLSGFDPALAAAARSRGIPVVVFLHSPMFSDHLGRVAEMNRRAGICAATNVISMAKWFARQIEDAYQPPAGTVRLIPLGTDLEEFRPDRITQQDARRRFELASDVPVIASVGNVEPRKRPDLAIEAFAAVRVRLPNAVLLIAGAIISQPYYETLCRRVAELGLSGAVRWLGSIDRPRIHEVYAASDVLVHCALAEPFGLVLTEAMGVGRPVVAVASQGPGEIVQSGRTGTLVPSPGNATDIGDALTQILARADRGAGLGIQARARAEALYDARLRIREIEDLLVQAMGHP